LQVVDIIGGHYVASACGKGRGPRIDDRRLALRFF
jgi:hypothetical protein